MQRLAEIIPDAYALYVRFFFFSTSTSLFRSPSRFSPTTIHRNTLFPVTQRVDVVLFVSACSLFHELSSIVDPRENYSDLSLINRERRYFVARGPVQVPLERELAQVSGFCFEIHFLQAELIFHGVAG